MNKSTGQNSTKGNSSSSPSRPSNAGSSQSVNRDRQQHAQAGTINHNQQIQKTPSQQQQGIVPSSDRVKAEWKQQVGNAKILWGKLTDDELLQTEGNAQKLTGLIQERYALSKEEADEQVKDFMKQTRH